MHPCAPTTHTVTLNLNGTPEGVAGLLAELFARPMPFSLEQVAEPAKATTTPPAIGEPWPGQGGLYAGLSRGVDGQPDAHLILALAAPDKALAWDAAVEWAQSVAKDGHVDFRLPMRAESALLFANLKDQCEPRWHWTGEQYSRTDAWGQHFVDGNQTSLAKSYEGRARAVRRFIP